MTRFVEPRHTLKTRSAVASAIALRFASPFALPWMLIALLVAFFVSYLFLMNGMTQKAFEITKLQQTVADLSREGKKMELSLARQESIAHLSEQVATLGMVPTERMEYLTVVSGPVAYR